MKIVPDELYPEMYWIQWPDRVKSADFYNIQRAKDHSSRIASTMARERPLEAHWCV